jgi:hypothetical protein
MIIPMSNHPRPDYIFHANGHKLNSKQCQYAVRNVPFGHNTLWRQCRKPRCEQVGEYYLCRQHAKIVRKKFHFYTVSTTNKGISHEQLPF